MKVYPRISLMMVDLNQPNTLTGCQVGTANHYMKWLAIILGAKHYI